MATTAQIKALNAIQAGRTETGNTAKINHALFSNLKRLGFIAADDQGRTYLTETGLDVIA